MEDTISFWEAITERQHSYPQLDNTQEVDVAIIGGGITGVTAALQLITSGKKVAIIEAEKVGGVTTGYSSGNLYIAVQPYYHKIISKFNEETAKQIALSRNAAIDYIERTIKEKQISCNYSRRPWYIYTDDDNKLSFIDKEAEAFKKIGFPLKETTSLPFPLKFKKAYSLENQARFNPLKYVVALAEDLSKQGCLIFENSRVMNIEEKNDKCTLTTKTGRIIARQTIIATHTPIGINPVQMFTAPYRSYVVAATLKDNIYPEGHFWDLEYPHHALCTHSISSAHPEIVMVAGNHHKVGQEKEANKHYDELENFLKKHLLVTGIPYKWSAQHYHSADDIPYIGLATRFSKNVYMGTGYFADGLVYGTVAGIILADLIAKKENDIAKTYRANRFTPMASAGFLLKEDSNVFLQYLKDFPFPSLKTFSDIKTGEGKVVMIDGDKCGVYRDENNKVHVVSAVCTHMKCIVQFNNAERTWDCPCHGSRFTTTGKVIEGPAQKDLKQMDVATEK